MRTLYKKIKYGVLVPFVKAHIGASKWVPWLWMRTFCAALSSLAFFFMTKTKQKTISNIRLAYPEKSNTEAHLFARTVFRNLGESFADVVKGLSIMDKQSYRNAVKIVGEEHVEAAYKKGKGVIALGCHLGPFELYPTYCGLHYPSVGVGTRLKNKELDRLLVENRTSRGIDFCHRGEGTLKMMRSLKQGKVLIILIDQDTNKVKNTFVRFYGRETSTPIGPALLALKTGAAVVPMAMSRKNGQITLTIKPEVIVKKTNDQAADITYNTQNFSFVLEELIKEHPEQWVWVHERWKTQPPKEVTNLSS